MDEEPTFFVYAPWPFLTARPHASLFSAYCMYSSSQSRICIVLFCKYIGNTRHTSKPFYKKKKTMADIGNVEVSRPLDGVVHAARDKKTVPTQQI